MNNALFEKSQFTLTDSISIFIPSTVGINRPIDNQKQVSTIFSKMAEIFGGCTAIEAQGGWVSPSTGLVIESVTICKSFTTPEQANNAQTQRLIIKWCEDLKKSMKQDAIGVEFNNVMCFI